jgi:predicted dehydrogenase
MYRFNGEALAPSRVHVVVEKPAVLSLAEADALAAAERQAIDAGLPGRFTQIVQHRFGAGIQRLRRLLDDGTLGPAYVAQCDTLWFRTPEYFAVPWRGRFDTEGGGTTMGHGIHQFDLLLAVLGPWTEVRAMAGWLARHTDTEAATVELERLYGYDDSSWTVTPVAGRDDVAEAWTADVAASAASVDGGASGHLAQLVPTYRALAAGQIPPVTVADTRATLALASAIYKSAFTDAAVHAGEIVEGDPFHASTAGTGTPRAPYRPLTSSDGRMHARPRRVQDSPCAPASSSVR